MEDPIRDLPPAPTGTTELGLPSAASERFQSCRWRSGQDAGAPFHCTHRDVLPFAGINGFTAEAWCPECTYYKPRRITRKRDDSPY